MAERSKHSLPAAHYIASILVKSPYNLAKFVVLGSVCGFLAGFSWGVNLLLRFPALFTMGQFSHAGPSEAQLAGCGFNMALEAYGYESGSDKLKHAVRLSF